MLQKKGLFRLIFLTLLICCMGITVCADSALDISKKGSISVTMRYNGNTVSGGTLTMYRVGELAQNGSGAYGFALTSEFAGSGQSLDDLSSSLMPGTLARYAANANISGTTVSIGSTGTASFTDLDLGVYLITQNKAATGYNTISSFLVTVPMSINNSYEYDVDASPKVELKKRSGSSSSSSGGSPKSTATPAPTSTPPGRSSSGSPTPTPNPSANSTPTPSGSSGTPDNPISSGDPSVSASPDEPTPTDETITSESPSESPIPGATDDPDAGGKPKLPQTGQLNWPIPLLAILGLAMFSAGWILRYGNKKYKR
jgi:LPXTG-motif cell wall-anchored protein